MCSTSHPGIREFFDLGPETMSKLQSLRGLLLAGVLAGLSLAASAEDRSFPENTRRGILKSAANPDIVIDDKLRRVSPSTRIYNEDNLIIMSGMLGTASKVVNYTQNDYGEVERIWLLTAAESATPLSSQKKIAK